MRRPFLGCSLRSLVDKPGMIILMVNTDSPAWHAGLKKADILLEIDGVEIHNINDYYAAIAKNQSKRKVIKVERDGD